MLTMRFSKHRSPSSIFSTVCHLIDYSKLNTVGLLLTTLILASCYDESDTNKTAKVLKKPTNVQAKESQTVVVLKESLCDSIDEVFLSCYIENSTKMLSVCGKMQDEKYLQYRFGQKDKLELVYPKHKKDSFKKFSFGYGSNVKGLNHSGHGISFQISKYRYHVSRWDYPADWPTNTKVDEPWVTKFLAVEIEYESKQKTMLKCTQNPLPMDKLRELVETRMSPSWHDS